MRRQVMDGWIIRAEAARRLEMSPDAFVRVAVELGVRRRLRPGMPPLYCEEDVAALVARIRIEGDGIAPEPAGAGSL